MGWSVPELCGDEFAYFVEVAEAFQGEVGVDAVFFEGALVVAVDLAVGGCAAGGGAALTHADELALYVARVYPPDEYHPQQILEVCSNLVSGVEVGTGRLAAEIADHRSVKPEPLVRGLAAVERRMRGHEAQAHQPSPEHPRRVIPSLAGYIVTVDVLHVSVHGVEVGLAAEGIGHGGEDVGGGEEIV